MTKQAPKTNKPIKPLKLLAVVLGMFGFGFALVPLYNVVCSVSGLNGKTGGQYDVTETLDVDKNRWITVQFAANNNADMPWAFAPSEVEIKVRPGEINTTYFTAKNPTDLRMVAQAVPSVSPFTAAKYLHKTECFCFTQQTLGPSESIKMPVKFFIDADIPERITKLTLNYTLFNLPDVAAN